MAELLRIGTQYLNLDQVTHIQDTSGPSGPQVRIWYATSNDETGGSLLEGQEAQALLAYLQTHVPLAAWSSGWQQTHDAIICEHDGALRAALTEGHASLARQTLITSAREGMAR